MELTHIPELIERLQPFFPKVSFIRSWPSRSEQPELPFAVVMEVSSERIEREPTPSSLHKGKELIAEGRGKIQVSFVFPKKEQEFEYRDKMNDALAEDYERDRAGKAGSIETPSGVFRFENYTPITTQKGLESSTRGALFNFDASWSIYAQFKGPVLKDIQLKAKISEDPKELDL